MRDLLPRFLKRKTPLQKTLEAARKGDAQAMRTVGLAYLQGTHETLPHHGHAAWWLEQAAAKGDGPACDPAARLAWEGVVPDEKALEAPRKEHPRTQEAFRLARLGHARANPQASLFLVWLLDRTRTQAPQERLEALQAAAQAGLPLAVTALADLEARSGASVESVMERLKEPLQTGLGAAHHLLAQWYARGQFLPRDAILARHHLETAASTDHLDAQALLGECLMVENHASPPAEDETDRRERLRRLTRGETLLRRAAQNGHGRAACVLGDYWAVIAEPKDMTQAMNWFRLGASMKDPGALYMYGRLTLEGQPSSADRERGLTMLREAAQAGHPGAQKFLKLLAQNG
ncbi:hypothetical protein AA0472_2613 [Acetobacter estunensis NRIC 0472]|nr:hypothetical protein AA0472_2613 [Acetobacter estunensis NRIC 0472]